MNSLHETSAACWMRQPSMIYLVSRFNKYQTGLCKYCAFSALTLLVGRQEGYLACKNCNMDEWWGAGVVVCLERDADLHMAQLMPLPLTVSCFSKIQIGVTFLVPAHPGSPGPTAIKCVCACVCVCVCVSTPGLKATRTEGVRVAFCPDPVCVYARIVYCISCCFCIVFVCV